MSAQSEEHLDREFGATEVLVTSGKVFPEQQLIIGKTKDSNLICLRLLLGETMIKLMNEAIHDLFLEKKGNYNQKLVKEIDQIHASHSHLELSEPRLLEDQKASLNFFSSLTQKFALLGQYLEVTHIRT